MDNKLIYLTKTLSRTKRKDYENYVINTIWNRINCSKLLPVTQQFIKAKDGRQYMIDLYFPQLNIGVECDEPFHQKQKEADNLRELTIFHILKQINHHGYTALHVNITTFEEVEKQINEHVQFIKNKINELNISDGWEILNENVADFYKNKKYISIYDNISFSTNKDVYNNILGKNYNGSYQKAGQILPDSHKTFVWFPKLTIDGRPVSSGYYNSISQDGRTITEYNKDDAINVERKKRGLYINQRRVVFTQTSDPITQRKVYRFVGVFVGKGYNDNGAMIYERIDDKFEIIRAVN